MDKKIYSQIKSSSRLGRTYLILCRNKENAHGFIQELVKDSQISLADLCLLDEPGNIKIAQIRQLQKFISLKPHSSLYKMAVVFQGNKLTTEASNALLKILEEPPKKSLILIVAQEKHELLATIVSRCQIIRLKEKLSRITPEKKQALNNEINNMRKMNVKERFDYCRILAEKNDLDEILTRWLLFFQDLLKKNLNKEYIFIIKKMRFAQKILRNSNVNKRLLLENLLLII